MKTLYFLSFCIIIIALSSCSSQRNAQTSDDTYYSQGRQTTTSNASQSEYDYYSANTSDQYLMMRVQDPNRWSTFDDYDYGYAGAYSPYSYGSSWIYSGFGFSPWMSYGLYPYYGYGFGYMNYYAWNCFHNPYYGGRVVIGNSYAMYGAYNQLHPFNVTSYNNRVITNSNVRNSRFYTPSANTRNSVTNNPYRNNTNTNRRNFYNNQNNNNSNYRQQNSQPVRSFTPSSNSGGGFGGGGGARGSFGHH